MPTDPAASPIVPGYPAPGDRVSQERAQEMVPEEFDVRKLPARYQFAFAVVKHFGFPILVSVALGAWIYYQDANAREDREADRAVFVGALEKNTAKLSELVQEIRRLEDSRR